jgi:hypothetical protein
MVTGCSDEILDTTRNVPERATLGEEIFQLFHRDMVRENERRALGFEMEHDRFVAAIDHLFQPDELRYTQDFMVKLLPLYDDGTIPNTTRMFAAMAERLERDPDALRSLSAIQHRVGYVDRSHEEALLRRIASNPSYPTLMKAILRLNSGHDGLDEFGEPDPNEPDELLRLMTVMAKNMSELQLSAEAERSIVLATDLLLSEDVRFGEPGAQPARIVARDARGMARVASVALPFADRAPADGLADVDEIGRFISAEGTAINLTPFSETGAATAFQYIDLEKTMLAGVLRDTRKLIADGVPMRMVRTTETLLGERTGEGTYSALNSPILDFVHALGATANTPQLPEVLELVRRLLEDHEATTAWLQLETQAQLDIADRYNVNLTQGSTFFDELMSVLRKILREPGLAEDLLEAVQDPAVAGLPDAQVLMMSNKKARVTPADLANSTVFNEPVDRAQPDSGGNESLEQRLLHLIYDTKGVRYVPELFGLPVGFIFQIDDLAEFYLLSIIGESHVPAIVSSLTGLPETPTPEDLAVFINQDQDFGNPRGHEGIDVKDNDGDTLFAATASGTCNALKPLIRVFYNRGQMRLLFELFEVLHLHWGTAAGQWQNSAANQPRFSKLSGIRGYEPLLIDTFQNAKVLEATRKLLLETKDVRTQKGRLAHDVLLILARKLLDKDPELRTLEGKREVLVDGERITPLSPFDLIRAARSKIKATVRRSAMAQADYDAMIDAFHETLLETERTSAEAGRLKNRRALPVASLLLKFLEERALRNERNLAAWVTSDFDTAAAELVSAEELPAILDLIHAIDEDEELNTALAEFRDELLDESRGFPDLLVTLGDSMEALKDASVAVHFIRFLGRELDPSLQMMFNVTRMTEKTLALDPDEHMLEVIRRAIDTTPERALYMYGVSGAIRQANRFNPVETAIVTGDDLEMISGVVSRYLLDSEHGLEKFYEMVKNRTLEGRMR